MNNPASWQSMLGQSLGHSDWFRIDQQRINHFADVTEDQQYIHVDPEAAAQSAFGGTIAHGYLTLSLFPSMMYALIAPYRKAGSTVVNYGSNKLRFLNPVKCDARIRLHMDLAAIHEKSSTHTLLTFESQMQIEGQTTPAFVAENLFMLIDEGEHKNPSA